MTVACHLVLVPTDFSETSQTAIEMAVELARRFDAELVLFHVQELPAYVFPDGVLPLSPEVLAQFERTSTAELERLAGQIRSHGVRVRTSTALGGQDTEILRAAEELKADLIVMGTHGRTGIRHALLGSVAERVVRRAPCPVLTVRPNALHHEQLPAP